MSKSYTLSRKEALYDLEDELGSEELAEKAIKFFESNRVLINDNDRIAYNLDIEKISKDVAWAVSNILDIDYEVKRVVREELENALK